MNHRIPPLATFGLLALALPLGAQVAPALPSTLSPTAQSEEVITLTPFEVKTEAEGYMATSTLAGNRLNTELRDIGSSVSIITKQFMQDINATSNETLLQYTLGTEVGNIAGNFAGTGDGAFLDESSKFTNPNQNTRVRGLAAADNSRGYFLSNIPWDGFNVESVELQRGPNSILFGQGSPAGIINTNLKEASYKNSGEVGFQLDSQGGKRTTIDVNQVLLKDELAVRFAALDNEQEFKQKPAFQDDRRGYAAARWEPKFLKIGSARTVIKGGFETGDVHSNRPRSLPPIDLITPFFSTVPTNGTFTTAGSFRDPATGEVRQVQAGDPRVFPAFNRQTFNAFQVQDDSGRRLNAGQQRTALNGGPDAGFINPAFNPAVGNFGQQFGGANVFFPAPGATPTNFIWEIRTNGGIGPDGQIDQGIGGLPFHRPAGIATTSSIARLSGLPFGQFGVYKNNQLTDASIFDFYNNLIDGDNKREWQNFTRYNFSVAQTFLHDKLGVEFNYNHEDYKGGQLALLSGERQAINLDLNSVLTDGSPAGLDGIPFQDGTPNPNVGRPFITDSGQFGNNTFKSDNDNFRFTGFLNHDFNQGRNKTWFTKLLGRHTLTGLYGEDDVRTDSRQFQRFAILDQGFRDALHIPASTKFNDNLLAVNRAIFLGPSLLDAPGIAGANIPRPAGDFVPTSGVIRAFNSTWNAPNVDPGALWENPAFAVGDASRISTQSENPANYVGFQDIPFNITDSEAAPGNRDLLTTNARLDRSNVKTKAFVWQSHFWNNAIVGTYGYRRDTARTYRTERDVNSSPGNGQLDLGETFRLPDEPIDKLKATSETYSVVGHLDQLPLLGRLTEKLPVALSVTYSDSQNFQAASSRVDIYGQPISAPKGDTKEKGFLVETRDGRFSLRVNHYKTKLQNATSSALNGAWFIGASQAWSGQWVNIFDFNLADNTIDTARAVDDPNAGRFTFAPRPGETQADADQLEQNVIAAWRTWQASVDPRFYQAWGINTQALADASQSIGFSTPNGFSVTEDSVSKGWEFEITAQPTRNWRVSLNATKTTATRSNIGGTALREFVSSFEDFLRNSPGGDLRIWWGAAGSETALFQWNNNIGSEFTSRKLQEGTSVPELRQWRVNAVNSYDFTEGALRGVTVGGGLRWQDKVTIGFPPVGVPGDPTQVSFDLDAPFQTGAETNIDLWIGYQRKFRHFDWRIQLNVTNVGEDNKLIAVTAQPDGTPAGFRIAPRQEWTLSNTFTF